MNGNNVSYLDTPDAEAIEPTGELFDGVLEGHKYSPDNEQNTYTITYSFPGPDSLYDQSSYSPIDHNWPNEGLTRLSATDIAHFEEQLAFLSQITNLEFIEVNDGGTSAGTIRPAWFNGNSVTFSGYAEAPYPARSSAGDIWFSQKNLTDGTHHAYQRIAIHELGHALGLKHPHEPRPGFPILDSEWLGREYTIMAYKVSAHHPSMKETDLHPQTFMYLDILALQYMYGVDTVTTGGNDTYQYSQGEHHYLTIWDAGGNDTLEVVGGNRPVSLDVRPGSWSNVGSQINYNNGTPLVQASENNTVYITPDVTIENATGADGHDTLQGNSVANRLKGNNGNDRIYGAEGDDLLVGGGGNDTLLGEAGDDGLWAGPNDTGNDRLIGGAGNDGLGGGDGNDLLIGGDTQADGQDTLSGGNGDDTLVGGGWQDTTGNGSGLFSEASTLLTGTEADKLWAGPGNDHVLAANGNDTIGAGGGHDSIQAGGGDDRIFAYSGDDTINGGPGDDLIYAGPDSDIITGGSGRDTLWGGSGDDRLTGGDEQDIFSFVAGSGTDIITDFDLNEDILRLVDTAIVFQSLADIENAATSNATGTLIDLGGGSTVLLEGIDLSDIPNLTLLFE